MAKHTATHGEFTFTRQLQAPKSKVYQMFADQTSKKKWFGAPNSSDSKHTMDFRVGGQEFGEGTFHDGVTHTFQAQYYDIVPDERIVYCYEMYLDGKRISVSVTTIEFVGDDKSTTLTLHEAGVFLDEFDDPTQRERGTKELLNVLTEALSA